ncbi:MAG TPA: ABC transporter ATP-binding protein [Planctomycetaceae bacterium]|nr:ABC transporter ATP-binding protein [Planctomycetaceae bacterium]
MALSQPVPASSTRDARAVEVAGLSHRYGERLALDGVSLAVERGEIFGLLGPNGGGKTTLFRILSTLLPVQEGSVAVLGLDARRQPDLIRRRIGVTFQSPSLDGKLTVLENLRHQGHLYGLSGTTLRERIAGLLERLGLAERAGDRAETLSGGLKRRVEIAKGLLHRPEVLLLDEPSTGLDPGARLELWRQLAALRADDGVTVVVTTHLMDEAGRSDRLGILDGGRLVALGTPEELRASVGGDCVTVRTDDPPGLAGRIAERFGLTPQPLGESLRIEHPAGHELVRELVEAFPESITSVSVGKPTLEDVFIARTGHRFWEQA